MKTTTPFADSLRTAISTSGLSAYTVAKRSGVSTQVVSRWLSRERDITLVTADKIAAALEIPSSISQMKTINLKKNGKT